MPRKEPEKTARLSKEATRARVVDIVLNTALYPVPLLQALPWYSHLRAGQDELTRFNMTNQSTWQINPSSWCRDTYRIPLLSLGWEAKNHLILRRHVSLKKQTIAGSLEIVYLFGQVGRGAQSTCPSDFLSLAAFSLFIIWKWPPLWEIFLFQTSNSRPSGLTTPTPASSLHPKVD